jgi:hypothetical protein
MIHGYEDLLIQDQSADKALCFPQFSMDICQKHLEPYVHMECAFALTVLPTESDLTLCPHRLRNMPLLILFRDLHCKYFHSLPPKMTEDFGST